MSLPFEKFLTNLFLSSTIFCQLIFIFSWHFCLQYPFNKFYKSFIFHKPQRIVVYILTLLKSFVSIFESLSIYDIITATNTAKENNSEYQNVNNYSSYYQITVYRGSDRLDDETQEQLEARIKAEVNSLKRYVCTNILYHDASGRVSRITFRQL